MIILQQTRGNLSSGDQLALDLQFAADKTLTARIGPTPVFSRASGATYVGSDGLIHGIDTSTTSNSISPGSKSFTLQATAGQDQFWRTGDGVEASNGGNSMVGTVTSYNSSTQVLVCNMTSIAGTGTFTSWRIGYRGPRFDHDPVTLASRGLLIEESRTNLILQSENHASASWNKTGATVAAVTHTAPDGNTSSNLVSEDSSTGLHRLFQVSAYVSGTSYAISVFLKFAGRQFVAITHPTVAANNGIAIFDIQNGSVTLQQSGITASMIQYPNGWWRCVVVGTSLVTSSQSHIIQGSTTGGVLTGSYTGLNGAAFYIYGSQIEAGSLPTSYIPTTTGTAARAADVCSITDISSFYAGRGTIFASSQLNGLSQLNGICGFNTGTNQICINRLTSTTRALTFGATPAVSINSAANIPPTTFVKSAFAFDINDAAYFNNNVLAGTATSLTLPSVTQFQVGGNGGQQIQSGTIAAIRYYRKRLPNAKLQAITV
ncbi:MAG: hypothetical protein KGQ87_03800 [Verrucomicrobia bacterium]|nr:hypothetical protein [Verrucomicrobiota bacterium]